VATSSTSRNRSDDHRRDERDRDTEQDERDAAEQRRSEQDRHEPRAPHEGEREARTDDGTAAVHRSQVAGPGAPDVEHADCKHDGQHVERPDHDERGDDHEHHLARRTPGTERACCVRELSDRVHGRLRSRERRHQPTEWEHEHGRARDTDRTGQVDGSRHGQLENEPRSGRRHDEPDTEDPAGDRVQRHELLGCPRDHRRHDRMRRMRDAEHHRAHRPAHIRHERRRTQEE
jgi:hypothetical protein